VMAERDADSAREPTTLTVPVETSEVSSPPSAAPGARALLGFPLDTRPRVEYRHIIQDLSM
jgi:hypothetical protein